MLAAEGLVQGHQVHVLGLHEGWKADLPGLSTDSKTASSSTGKSSGSPPAAAEKMKIAWRYETMGAPRSTLPPFFRKRFVSCAVLIRFVSSDLLTIACS